MGMKVTGTDSSGIPEPDFSFGELIGLERTLWRLQHCPRAVEILGTARIAHLQTVAADLAYLRGQFYTTQEEPNRPA